MNIICNLPKSRNVYVPFSIQKALPSEYFDMRLVDGSLVLVFDSAYKHIQKPRKITKGNNINIAKTTITRLGWQAGQRLSLEYEEPNVIRIKNIKEGN